MKPTHPGLEGEDLKLFKSVYDENFEDLFIYAKAITRTDDLANEVVSDVFFDLLKSQKALRYIRDARAYLFKSVKNGCIKVLSRDPIKFQYLQEDQEYQLVEFIDPEEVMLSKELEDFIHQSIEKLSPQCQLVFRMVREENKPYSEVAEELEISPNTVRNHMVAATKCLKTELTNYYSDPKIIKLVSTLAVGLLMIQGLQIF